MARPRFLLLSKEAHQPHACTPLATRDSAWAGLSLSRVSLPATVCWPKSFFSRLQLLLSRQTNKPIDSATCIHTWISRPSKVAERGVVAMSACCSLHFSSNPWTRFQLCHVGFLLQTSALLSPPVRDSFRWNACLRGRRLVWWWQIVIRWIRNNDADTYMNSCGSLHRSAGDGWNGVYRFWRGP